MLSKRGQGLSTNAIILIVLGVVVLAVLVIGFTMGWDKIAPWLSTSNVDTIVTQCGVACSINSVNDYCNVERELKFSGTLGDLKSGEKYTCDLLSGVSQSSVEKCPGIQPCSSASQVEKTYVWVVSLNECVADNEKIVANSNCASVTPEAGKTICCERPI